jgi:uncharacterized protein YbaP (TraB family)
MKSSQHSPALARGLALVGLVAALSACKTEQEQAPPQPAPTAPAVDTPAAKPAPSAPPVETLARPFLWEARRNGTTSHFLGTIHAKYQLTHQPPAVTERLDAAKVVVVETDVTKLSLTDVLQQAMLPPEQSLRVMLGDEHWRKLVGAVGHIMPAAALERMQPWFVVMVVSLGDLIQEDQSQVMDLQVVQRASKAGKRVVYLEDPGAQLEMLTKSGDLEVLKEMLDELDEVHSKLASMLASYGRGDFEALSAVTLDEEEMRERPELFEKLLFERNRAWMKVLEPLLAEGGAFVAVGAGHFVGEQGLLSLLRAAGYEIHRVEP